MLVDEYQDTNRLQASILLALKPDGRGLTVVGDDAQSIYSFRAATVRNILDFPDQLHARRPRSSRSTATTARPQPILAAANARDRPGRASASPRTSGPSGNRRSKPQLVTVRDEADQARYVVETRAREPRGRHAAEAAGGAVPHLAAIPARSRSS